MTELDELNAAIERILNSNSRKKLVVAGPGTGKTWLFKKILESLKGDPQRRLALTFINNLRDDLEKDLSELAKVCTLHSYCLGKLYSNANLRGELTANFKCVPGLANLIRDDWRHIENSEPPHFVVQMRKLDEANNIPFYISRGNYYDAVDFDDTVYRVFTGLASGIAELGHYDLVLVDEYQDFNRLESKIIDILAQNNPILIVGDDDQALYGQLREASWDYIRFLESSGEYETFRLPFCMRCPKVVVDAMNDIIVKSANLRKLSKRISKPFKYFPPAKEADSAKYPKISLIETSVQRKNANYMGGYITKEIRSIPSIEIEQATENGYPAALIIASNPYRNQIVDYLQETGLNVDTRQDKAESLSREKGLMILKNDRDSNLGWRIVLQGEPDSFRQKILAQTADLQHLKDVLPAEYRDRILAEAETFDGNQFNTDLLPEPAPTKNCPQVKVTSFQGAKGLSAQHVFIAGLHDGEIPHDASNIRDIEICKFIVGLTRTRKKCTILYTKSFAGQPKSRSTFISWINADRFEEIYVNSSYWRRS